MQRLLNGPGKNSPHDYNLIFKQRAQNDVNWADSRRWKELIRHFKGGYIIDIGCLDSRIWSMVHSKFWKKQNYRYLGTDVAEEAIKEMARKHPYANTAGESLCSFIVDNIYKTKIRAEIADYALLAEVLEHMEYPEEVVANAFSLLKSGGVLAISVPLNEATEPGAVDGERHLWSYDKNDLKELVSPFSSKVKFKVLRSKWFPYKYCFPQLICFAWKKTTNN